MSLTITNTYALRLFYKNNVNLVTNSNRADVTTGTLSFADSTALRVGIRRLQEYNFEDASEEEVQKNLQAFVDTYNNTLQSGKKYISTDSSIKGTLSTIKNLTSVNSEDLEKLGISIEKGTGYMTLSSTAAQNINRERYSKFFTNDNEYLNDLYSYSKRIARRVDVQL